ncbi:armadillo-type protein [Sphaerosporella brunnea]|uniref:V-type proton ATPase subunit H n=1 Tax=Sphaerosporella brunnea TaxID=1250544 RepID=A0A5J5EEZ0_9PEZI|nr:armadillo-type protein [Sphaerosporella brunnea]
MSLDGQNILDEYKSLIRGRAVAWDAYIRYSLVTESDVKKIKAVDKVSKERRVSIVENDAGGYAQLVLGDDGVLRKSANGNRVDLVQYILMWTGDLLEDVPDSFADALLSLPKPFELLLSLLEGHSDPVIPVLTAAILTPLLAKSLSRSSKISPAFKDALPKFFRYLASITKSPEREQQDLAIQSYVALLRTPYARETFWDIKEETMTPLAQLIEETAGGTAGGERAAGTTNTVAGIVQGGVPLQLVYHVLLAVWELTFDDTVAEELNEKYDLIPPITAILRNPVKEKITRVCLAILVNLVTKAPSANLPPLLVTNILPYLQTLSQRFTVESDPDLMQDLATLQALLEAFQNEQTTLSSYRIEVMSGHLRWSPPHRNEGFWKRHARDILEDTELVRQLARLLGSAQDKTVLAVACNDVGILVKEVPYSHKKWVELGVKNRVMELMGDSDPEVRYEALKAVQGFLQTAFSG